MLRRTLEFLSNYKQKCSKLQILNHWITKLMNPFVSTVNSWITYFWVLYKHISRPPWPIVQNYWWAELGSHHNIIIIKTVMSHCWPKAIPLFFYRSLLLNLYFVWFYLILSNFFLILIRSIANIFHYNLNQI